METSPYTIPETALRNHRALEPIIGAFSATGR